MTLFDQALVRLGMAAEMLLDAAGSNADWLLAVAIGLVGAAALAAWGFI